MNKTYSFEINCFYSYGIRAMRLFSLVILVTSTFFFKSSYFVFKFIYSVKMTYSSTTVAFYTPYKEAKLVQIKHV